MAALKRRTRTVIFRLTDEEYEALKAACLESGARTVSDFARSELLRSVGRDQQEVAEKLAEIESGMHRLEELLAGIARPPLK